MTIHTFINNETSPFVKQNRVDLLNLSDSSCLLNRFQLLGILMQTQNIKLNGHGVREDAVGREMPRNYT